MMSLYRLCTSLFYRAVYPFVLPRARHGRELWRGRLGLISKVGPVDVWMHAASVGETRVLSYLVKYLLKKQEDLRLHLTAMTETGFQTAVSVLPSEVTVSFFPFDAQPAILRTLERVQPRSIVIAETEIWPNLIVQADSAGIPIILVNGRMSARAFKRYSLIRKLMTGLLGRFDRCFFKTAEDAARFHEFGVLDNRSEIAGDMKFDAPLLERSEGRIRELRHRMGVTDDQFLLIAGSTRSGEEQLLLEMYRRIKKNHSSFRLLLAPRHVERADEIMALLDRHHLPCHRYGDTPGHNTVILVDKIGLLAELYMAADVAFVGGTLVDIGGHNLVEPVWAGTPVLFGPSLSNVGEAAAYIKERSYGACVETIDELRGVLIDIMAGDRSFCVRSEKDLKKSATSSAGDYILKRLNSV